MRTHFYFFLIVLSSALFFSCKGKDEKKDKPMRIPLFYEVQRIDCESNNELCNNRPGLKFTALAPVVKDNRPNWNLELRMSYQPDPYTLTICCDTIPRLIDSLVTFNELLETWRKERPEHEERTCMLPDSITITIFFRKDFTSAGDYGSMEFGKVSDGSVFFVFTKEGCDKLIEDTRERFRTCCLN